MKASRTLRRRLRTLGKLCLPVLATLVIGCGGSSDSGSYVVTGDAGGGGGNNTPAPTGETRQFSFNNFGANSRATLVVGNTPAGETTSAGFDVAVAVEQGLGALGRVALTRGPETTHGASCGTADVRVMSDLMGLQDPAPLAQSSPTVRRRFQELPAGAQQDFYLITRHTTKKAEKVLAPNETVHCTIFAELGPDGEPCISREKALSIASAFDSNNPARPGSGIYAQVREVFGSEWTANGGIDGDSKVVLLFFRGETLGAGLYGFTSPIDSRPGATDFSNQAEILYLNADKSEHQTLSTLAHEFQHLVCENQKVIRQGTFPEGAKEENVSLNEGLSELAEEICGFTLESGNTLLAAYINDYLSRTEDHEFFSFGAAGVGYGQGYLFYKYIYEHHGASTIRSMATSTGVGMANLDTFLPNGFKETFRRWSIANWATNLSGTPSMYRYPSGFQTNGNYAGGQLTGVVPIDLRAGFETTSPGMGAWSVGYFTYAGGNGTNLRLSVKVPPNSPAQAIYEEARGAFGRVD